MYALDLTRISVLQHLATNKCYLSRELILISSDHSQNDKLGIMYNMGEFVRASFYNLTHVGIHSTLLRIPLNSHTICSV